jgi:methylmalonyl-CoA mutase C-terminal domain/subunit
MDGPVETIRVLLCNPGLDGHDRGVKVVARALRDAGMEVIYLPLRTSVAELVRVAVQEDVDVVGISNLSASLVSICRQVRSGLAAAGADDVLVVAGGTVLDEDRALLKREGIEGVFGPGSSTRDIIAFIRQNVSADRRAARATEEAE